MAGLAKNVEADTVLVGTSMAANYRASQIEEAFGTSAVRLTIPDGYYSEFDQVLGLDLLAAAQKQQAEKAAPQEGDAEIDALVQARTDAKKAKNFAEADRIRDQLKEMGIVLVDSKEGTTWHR